MNKKQAAFLPQAEGDCVVETPDGTNKVMGDQVRNGLYDADYVSMDCAYGAFRPDDEMVGYPGMSPRQGLRHLKDRGEL